MSLHIISWRARLLTVALTLVIVASIVVGVTIVRNHHTPSNAAPLHNIPASNVTITIARAQDIFAPFILPIMPGTIVTWKNNDSVAHIFSTTPSHQSFVNPEAFSFSIVPGHQVSFRFIRPGIYHYYETTKDTWSSRFSRVVANNGLRHYPLSMEGVIWVQGPLRGLPVSAINFVVQGHDMFATEFLAIAVSGVVTWHNLDEDVHFIGPANPVDMGLYRMAGTNDVPGGQSVSVLFNKPGLYYYYCRNHAMFDPQLQRVEARTMSSEYPIPMEGFVLVA